MRDVHSSYSASIAHPEVALAEIYIFELSDGQTILRYTTHGEDLTWDAAGNTYTAYPMARSDIKFKNTGEFDDLEIYMANIEGDLYDQLQANVLESVTITIKRIPYQETYAATKEITLFIGKANITFNRGVLQLTCRPIINSLNIAVPRHMYQEPCNHVLFDETCGLTRSDYAYSGTATGGSETTLIDTTRGTLYLASFDDATGTLSIGDTITGSVGGGTAKIIQITYMTTTTGYIWFAEMAGAAFIDDEVLASGANNVTINGAPAEHTPFYERGELEMLTGDNIGHRRPILSNSGSTVTLFWPFPNAVSAGDTYNIYPGCDKRWETCTNRFDNVTNFRGFPYIPRWEETVY